MCRLDQCRVPPSPDVMAELYVMFLDEGKPQGLTFSQYLHVIGYGNPAADTPGMDDNRRFRAVAGAPESGPELIEIPRHPVAGKVRVIVLLVDFPDKVGHVPKRHFERLLFSRRIHPTGSLDDYYREVTLGKVQITGSVHGWLRLPQPYSYYTNGESGMKRVSYPRNAQKMAEDSVVAALANGVVFDPGLDKTGEGIVTALFIVHAGRGAEVLHPSVAGGEIWSHKWNLRRPIEVAPGLTASVYLTVPEDCKMGVCAHELGHLAFGWQDFYDPNYDQDGRFWDGTGVWDLMAGGSYNGGGARPAHPAALHKTQHGWVEVEPVRRSSGSVTVTLPAYTATSGKVARIESTRYKPGQYLMLENRRRQGFDSDLPGAGMLVWRVDEAGEQDAPDVPGLTLIQADGRHDLDKPNDWNQGDAGDPFPGTSNVRKLDQRGSINTSFPRATRSGVVLSDVVAKQDGSVSVKIRFGVT